MKLCLSDIGFYYFIPYLFNNLYLFSEFKLSQLHNHSKSDTHLYKCLYHKNQEIISTSYIQNSRINLHIFKPVPNNAFLKKLKHVACFWNKIYCFRIHRDW